MGKSTRRKAGDERLTPIHDGVKNYDEVPALYSSLAHKRRTLAWQRPFSGCSLERRHKMDDILLEQHHLPSSELADLTYKRHVVVINIGQSSTWEFKKDGRFRRFFKARGAISFFPSHQDRSKYCSER